MGRQGRLPIVSDAIQRRRTSGEGASVSENYANCMHVWVNVTRG